MRAGATNNCYLQAKVVCIWRTSSFVPGWLTESTMRDFFFVLVNPSPGVETGSGKCSSRFRVLDRRRLEAFASFLLMGVASCCWPGGGGHPPPGPPPPKLSKGARPEAPPPGAPAKSPPSGGGHPPPGPPPPMLYKAPPSWPPGSTPSAAALAAYQLLVKAGPPPAPFKAPPSAATLAAYQLSLVKAGPIGRSTN